MRSLLLIALLSVLVAMSAPAALVAEPQSATHSTPERALLSQYCVTCHNERLKTAGVQLDTANVGDVSADAELWERVIRKLQAGAMPPAGRPRPDQAAVKAFLAHLEGSLDRAAAARPNPGRTDMFHRLNRIEYQNAVSDLLGVEVDPALLPPDEAGGNGFDNMAGGLSISPALVERYMSAARKISRLAIGRPPTAPVIESYDALESAVEEGDRLSEDLPFGSRGGVAVRHTFPVDGEYVIAVRLWASYTDYVRGMDSPHMLDIRLDGARITQFTVGGKAPGTPAPLSYAGKTIMEPEWEQYMRAGANEGLEVRIPVKAGRRLVSVSFPREQWEPDGVLQPRVAGHALSVSELPDENPGVARVIISGPHAAVRAGRDAAIRDKIFTCAPSREAEEMECARRILLRLARRAFRRPVSDTDVRAFLAFYRTGRREGSFDAGIAAALQALLVDPDFLFRIERDPVGIAPNTDYRLSDLEVASRLSFFLWATIPDEELLGTAVRGTLTRPATLERQARRMLSTPRAAKSFVDNFAGQWLLLRNLKAVTPDPVQYPDFDENLREAFRRETELVVEYGLREDRSVLELLSADYTFVNERLARHYGIPNVYGSRFRKVALANQPRGGLLGHGSLLTVTSYPDRTSPVLRGKWLLGSILGTPPPPPPPDVPALPDARSAGTPTTVRERLEQHRKNPVCAGCHAPMDPLGFALENFDGIGAWRARDGGAMIDASAALPNGAKFNGPLELRTVLVDQREQFVRTVTEKLLMYALGREIGYYDQPTIRNIVRQAAASNYRWSSIVLGIVKSPAFQMRRSAS